MFISESKKSPPLGKLLSGQFQNAFVIIRDIRTTQRPGCQFIANTPRRGTTCRLFMTICSTYSQVPSTKKDILHQEPGSFTEA